MWSGSLCKIRAYGSSHAPWDSLRPSACLHRPLCILRRSITGAGTGARRTNPESPPPLSIGFHFGSSFETASDLVNRQSLPYIFFWKSHSSFTHTYLRLPPAKKIGPRPQILPLSGQVSENILGPSRSDCSNHLSASVWHDGLSSMALVLPWILPPPSLPPSPPLPSPPPSLPPTSLRPSPPPRTTTRLALLPFQSSPGHHPHRHRLRHHSHRCFHFLRHYGHRLCHHRRRHRLPHRHPRTHQRVSPMVAVR